ncbi:uncharacterized protein LOC113231121 [Hyposmocoma kahamanoa]|uniref:uncharacterized protein LOC113231121 n=1 Tax=Hyposmocoma kahamanoa TaxID=1477025 RepID=UPI000E6D81F4|nr:uncharacterized protein LOC113231121 [Hyposmocoma kahamanoa]
MVLTGASASLVELNATTLASLPPLYDLDDWYQCQGPGDVYCIVDAALTSTEKSPLLELLQEYSSQTLKHYNRTQIHRGLCVTKCSNDTTGSRRDAAQRCVSRQMRVYGLDAQVLNVDWCTSPDSEPGTGGARALAVFCVVLLAFVLAATALHALCDSCLIVGSNKYLLAFSLKQNWKILTYDRSKPRTDDRMKDVACMEGVRALANDNALRAEVALLVTASSLTYAVSVPLVLLIELPAIQLWKALTEGGPRPPPSPRAPTPPSLAKTFDLVAHIRRRHEV